MTHTILAINPGSTSTKLAVFHDEHETAATTINHSAEELARYASVAEQRDLRLKSIHDFLGDTKPDAVVGRGGLMRPIPSGVYRVCLSMIDDLMSARFGEHASNLGAPLAQAVADEHAVPAFIVDPVVVDEMDDIARITGLPEIQRLSRFHALNHKSSAREAARKLGRPYEKLNLIIAHLGGGISVAAHRRGRVVDVNNALHGDGPFSPERCGTTPTGPLVEMCFAGDLSKREILKRLAGRGGLVAHLGTNDLREVDARIQGGDKQAKLVLDALAHQVSKEIASHGATLCGKVDAIVITGGIAHDKMVVNAVRRRIKYLARVIVIPGEREMISLATNALAILRGERKVKSYPGGGG